MASRGRSAGSAGVRVVQASERSKIFPRSGGTPGPVSLTIRTASPSRSGHSTRTVRLACVWRVEQFADALRSLSAFPDTLGRPGGGGVDGDIRRSLPRPPPSPASCRRRRGRARRHRCAPAAAGPRYPLLGLDLLEQAGGRRRADLSSLRMRVNGVRTSCEASATNCCCRRLERRAGRASRHRRASRVSARLRLGDACSSFGADPGEPRNGSLRPAQRRPRSPHHSARR